MMLKLYQLIFNQQQDSAVLLLRMSCISTELQKKLCYALCYATIIVAKLYIQLTNDCPLIKATRCD